MSAKSVCPQVLNPQALLNKTLQKGPPWIQHHRCWTELGGVGGFLKVGPQILYFLRAGTVPVTAGRLRWLGHDVTEAKTPALRLALTIGLSS